MEFHFVIEEYNRMREWCKENLKHDPICDKALSEWLDGAAAAAEFELRVMEWSKSNPRPKYPTIGDLVDDIINLSGNPDWRHMKIEEVLRQEIPETAAKQYGIVPLNLFDINKYCEEPAGSEWR